MQHLHQYVCIECMDIQNHIPETMLHLIKKTKLNNNSSSMMITMITMMMMMVIMTTLTTTTMMTMMMIMMMMMIVTVDGTRGCIQQHFGHLSQPLFCGKEYIHD